MLQEATYKTALNEEALFLNDEESTLFVAFKVKENLCEVTFDSY